MLEQEQKQEQKQEQEQDRNHGIIIANVKSRITAVRKEIETDIEDAIKKLKQHSVAIEGPLCASFAASVREGVLERYRFIKADIYQIVINTLIQEGQLHSLHSLQELTEKRTNLESEKREADADRMQVEENYKSLHDYEKFMLYGEPNKKRGNKSSKKNAPVKSGGSVRKAQAAYVQKRNLSYILGAAITFFFAMMDFSIIYSVFMDSNMGLDIAFITAFFTSVALDAPPYILGVVWTAKGDQRQILEMRLKLDNKEKITKNLRRFNVAIVVLCLATVLFFIAYLLVRIFLFLGGGNFDLALHFFINKEFNFESIKFNSADLISTFVPFVTSAMAFALGLLTSVSYVEHIKKMVVIINDDLRSQIKQYEQKAAEYDGKIKDMDSEIDTKECEIWTHYFHDRPLPDHKSVFRQEVAIAFQTRNLERYVGTYKTCCRLLRGAAEAALHSVNQGLAPHVAAAMQYVLNTMPVSDREKDILDELWVRDESIPQRHTTEEQIQEIEAIVQELVKPATVNTN